MVSGKRLDVFKECVAIDMAAPSDHPVKSSANDHHPPAAAAPSPDVLFDRLCHVGQRAMDLFRKMNTDHSGHIKQDEFVKGIHSLGISQGFSDAAIEALFEAIDEVSCRRNSIWRGPSVCSM